MSEHWQAMAEEVALDVRRGRMEGPFRAPTTWTKDTVPLSLFEHTSKLLQLPDNEPTPCAFAFPVIQFGSDGRRKIRRAEDWKRSGANSTNTVQDKPACHDIYAFVEVMCLLRDSGQDLSTQNIVTWALDHEDAYRQFPAKWPWQTGMILHTPSRPTMW